MTRVGINLLFLEDGSPSGTGTYAWSLIRELAERDDLTLVVFVPGEAASGNDVKGKVQFVRHRRFRSVAHRIAYEQAILPIVASRQRLDVLFNPAYVAPAWGRTPTVTTVHDLYYARCPAALPRLRRLYYRFGTRISARRSKALIAVSASTEADLLALVPASRGKTVVIHEAVRKGLVEEGETTAPADPPVAGPYFLVVASVTANKNVDTVVRAALRLDERRPGEDPVTVQMVGTDPYGILARTIEAHDAAEHVIAVGTVPEEDLRRYYLGAVAVIHPSRYEGFGLPALEAQALGAPLICSRGGALPEVVGEGARYFDHTDVDSLVDAMEALLADDVLRASLIEAGHQNVRRFSWHEAAERTAAVLREVADR